MARYAFLLGVAAVALTLSCSSSFAQVGGGGGGGGGGGPGGGRFGGGPGGGPLQNPYTDQYNQMNDQLTLTDDEKTKVKADVDDMNKELDAFQQDAQQKIRQSMRGGGGGGGAGQGAARDQIRQSMEDYATLADVHQIKIDADLTPDQKETWETYKLNRQLEPRLTALGLDDDQKAKAKDDIDAAAKLIAAAADAKDLPPIRGQLIKKIVAEVLTDAQAAKILTTGAPGPGMVGRGGMGGGQGGGGGRRGGQGSNGGGNGGNGNGNGGGGNGPAVTN